MHEHRWPHQVTRALLCPACLSRHILAATARHCNRATPVAGLQNGNLLSLSMLNMHSSRRIQVHRTALYKISRTPPTSLQSYHGHTSMHSGAASWSQKAMQQHNQVPLLRQVHVREDSLPRKQHSADSWTRGRLAAQACIHSRCQWTKQLMVVSASSCP